MYYLETNLIILIKIIFLSLLFLFKKDLMNLKIF